MTAPLAGLVEVEAVTKHYPAPRSWRDLAAGRRPVVRAVDGISFAIPAGASVGLVGESGSGKTTTGRMLLALTRPTAGAIRFEGQPLAGLAGERLRQFRRDAQLVFQNPFDALNPRFTVRRALLEPLVVARIPRAEHADRLALALERVHLRQAERLLDRYPHQLSGGQLQRAVLARALLLEPRFIVADEPVSMLDVSVRAGILNLLREVRRGMGLTALYISHDLALVRYVCDRTLVLYRGKVVEDGPTESVIRSPLHPYTQALIQATPSPRVDQSRAPLPLVDHAQDDPAVGCRFRARCPHAMARCAAVEPVSTAVAGAHMVACHLHTP